MTPSQTRAALLAAHTSLTPVMLWGSPGIGKSDTVCAFADSLDLSLIDIRASQLDPVDLRGVPSVENGRTRWNPPELLPHDPLSRGILFFDELPNANQLVQVSLYQLFLDRSLGEYTLPSGWFIVAAGNRQQDRTGVQRMPAALANRMIHIDMEPSLSEWTGWASVSGIVPEVIAFVNWRPELLDAFDPSNRSNPTPRSWAFVSRFITQVPDDAVRDAMISGTVGEAAGAEFLGFMRVWRSLQSYAAIIADPSFATIPDRPDALHATVQMIAARLEPQHAPQGLAYVNRMPGDFRQALIASLGHRGSPVCETPAFVQMITQQEAFA